MSETPTIEVVREPWDSAVQHDLVIDLQYHEVVGSYPHLEYLRDRGKAPNIFIYVHRESKRTMLCNWLYRQKWGHPLDICQELEGTDNPPTQLWPWELPDELMILRCRPIEEEYERMKRRRREQEYQVRKAREEGLQQRNDVVSYLRRRGLTSAARLIGEGGGGWAPPTDVSRETTDRMLHLRKHS